MKYYLLPLLLIVTSILFAQVEENDSRWNNELSTDLSGAFTNHFRVDFNRLGKKKSAWVLGLRMRPELVSVTTDTNSQIRFEDRTIAVGQGLRSLDIAVGYKKYFGENQLQRGFWLQAVALTSLVQWQSDSYKTALTQSFYPGEFIEAKRLFGIEGAIGYRYVFDNGISLNSYFSLNNSIVRRELITDRFPTLGQRVNGGFDFIFAGSFLTLGYVW